MYDIYHTAGNAWMNDTDVREEPHVATLEELNASSDRKTNLSTMIAIINRNINAIEDEMAVIRTHGDGAGNTNLCLEMDDVATRMQDTLDVFKAEINRVRP